ncbi:unnamed protein product [Arctia plantaginis]|uniref:CRAL-TRIO domain-containing protein n=1 Tax=Arctia plantaginis TaxID=874455 RepID=A0A8S1AHV2_ARCPL|nr:unnamed protein product [Arctia plantaginis]
MGFFKETQDKGNEILNSILSMASASVMVKSTGQQWSQVKKVLKEDPTLIKKDLAIIKDWLKKQPHLPNEWEDTCLISFLRGCDFSIERCKRKLDMYFTVRAACPEFFTNRDITRPELMELMNKGHGPTMPGLTPDGRRVSICRAKDFNLDTHQLNELFKITLMIGDLRLLEPLEGVTGEVYILDASIVRPSHLGKLSLSAVKKFFICAQEAYPVKLKELHVINTSALIDTAYGIVKPFLKEKMKKRIYFHKDFTGLHKFIPKELLPTEFDGTAGSLDDIHKVWVEKLKSYTGWFKKQESIKANESLRPGKPKNYYELFGMEGSFRQLAID